MIEEYPLLTGDKDLREAAEREAVIVMSAIWLINQMVRNRLVTVNQAKQAYKKMKEARRRLPWNIAEEKLSEIQNRQNNDAIKCNCSGFC